MSNDVKPLSPETIGQLVGLSVRLARVQSELFNYVNCNQQHQTNTGLVAVATAANMIGTYYDIPQGDDAKLEILATVVDTFMASMMPAYETFIGLVECAWRDMHNTLENSASTDTLKDSFIGQIVPAIILLADAKEKVTAAARANMPLVADPLRFDTRNVDTLA
ncbi:hypothetical protein EOL96_02610 [Candidatus Saccharibacteria bacterium]|nr:hypothetical protein [Candidatus Saccharibacteria bacterium]